MTRRQILSRIAEVFGELCWFLADTTYRRVSRMTHIQLTWLFLALIYLVVGLVVLYVGLYGIGGAS